MQGYLFPSDKRSLTDPFQEILARVLPETKHSLLLVMPSPDDQILTAIAEEVPDTVIKRILIRKDLLNLGDSVPPDILKPETRRLIEKHRIEVRALSRLSATILFADDRAVIISGNPGGLSWGTELNVIDAQPVMDHWESQFNQAARISDATAMEIWDQYQERFWRGGTNPSDVVALYNNRGAFVDIQVRIFAGYRQMTIYPFAASNRGGEKGPVVRWKLIDSSHFQAIGKQAARIHGLKSLGMVRDTVAGAYLRRSDFSNWNQLFLERDIEFKQFIENYLSEHYSALREIALSELLAKFLIAHTELQKTQRLLPMLDEEYVEDHGREFHHQNFPSKETLQFACQARYILFGLHPDASNDQVLMKNLSSSAVSDILL